MSLTNYGENLVANYAFNTESVTRPTAWYVGLHTEDPTEAGDTGEVTTGEDADYVRKAVTFGAASSGQVASTGAISWTVNSGSAGYTVTHVVFYDALTSGNAIAYGALASGSRTLSASDVLTFNTGELVVTVD